MVHSSWWDTELSLPRSNEHWEGTLQAKQAVLYSAVSAHDNTIIYYVYVYITARLKPRPLPVQVLGRPTLWLDSYPVSHTQRACEMRFIGNYSTFLGNLMIFMSTTIGKIKVSIYLTLQCTKSFHPSMGPSWVRITKYKTNHEHPFP